MKESRIDSRITEPGSVNYGEVETGKKEAITHQEEVTLKSLSTLLETSDLLIPVEIRNYIQTLLETKEIDFKDKQIIELLNNLKDLILTSKELDDMQAEGLIHSEKIIKTRELITHFLHKTRVLAVDLIANPNSHPVENVQNFLDAVGRTGLMSLANLLTKMSYETPKIPKNAFNTTLSGGEQQPDGGKLKQQGLSDIEIQRQRCYAREKLLGLWKSGQVAGIHNKEAKPTQLQSIVSLSSN